MLFARAARASMLIALISVTLKTSGAHTCWFEKKTRSGEECRGKLRQLSPGIARYVGTSTDAWACTRHWTRINRELNRFCACPLTHHSNDIHGQNIPQRLLEMFDRIGESVPGYRRGIRWCNQCYKNADRLFKNEIDYHPPEQVKNIMFMPPKNIRTNPSKCTCTVKKRFSLKGFFLITTHHLTNFREHVLHQS